ncbi:MAG: DUF5689 domain-containing protein [Bacteroidota bacterium]|nr:DUF5689 domain-containing protein [Bacteroidota bacterium]
MKYQTILKIVISLVVLSGFVACELEYDTPPVNTVDEDKILNIADIYQIHADSGDNYVFTEAYMLYATVAMSDHTGNIYKEAYVQDSTGGINLYRLDYPGLVHIGDYVRINLKDVVVTYYAGKLELVFEDVEDCGNQIIVQDKEQSVEPIDITMDDLTTNAYDLLLVRFSNVQFADSELGLTYADINGTSAQSRTLEDCNGNSLVVRSSDYSDFANDTLPEGNGSIIGISTTYVNPYNGDTTRQLLIRTPDEVSFEGLRCDEQ